MNRIPHPALHLLVPLLITHNSDVQESRFSEASYPCEICLTSIRGARCVRLSCSHIFCRSCLEDFWTLHITEGDAGRVGCPDPRCVKDGREANEEEVRRVVTEEDVQRWKWLRLKRALEKGKCSEVVACDKVVNKLNKSGHLDPTMVYCPLAFCQTAVPKPPNIEEGSGWERLRTCPECDFSFCTFCSRTWYV